MAELIVDKDGMYGCTGEGHCGGTQYENKESIKKCFNCEYCDSFKKEGLKIINHQKDIALNKWF